MCFSAYILWGRPLRSYKSPRVKNKFIEAHNKHFKVVKIYWVLNMNWNGYYAWSSNPDSVRILDNAMLLGKIKQFSAASGNIWAVQGSIVTAKLPA